MQSNLYSLIISYSFGSHTSVEPKMNQTGLTEDTFLLGWGYTSVAQHLLAGMRSCHRSHFSLHIAECEWLSETSWVERPVLLFFNPMSKSQFLPCQEKSQKASQTCVDAGLKVCSHHLRQRKSRGNTSFLWVLRRRKLCLIQVLCMRDGEERADLKESHVPYPVRAPLCGPREPNMIQSLTVHVRIPLLLGGGTSFTGLPPWQQQK